MDFNKLPRSLFDDTETGHVSRPEAGVNESSVLIVARSEHRIASHEQVPTFMIRRLIPAKLPQETVHIVDGRVEGDDGRPLVCRRLDAAGMRAQVRQSDRAVTFGGLNVAICQALHPQAARRAISSAPFGSIRSSSKLS